MKFGIIVIAALLLIMGARVAPQAQDNEDKAHRQWLEERYKEATSIKPGMTRADLLKLFVQEGGFQSLTAPQRYVLKGCNLIHLEVSFDKYDSANRRHDDSVRITDVSKPYLDRMVID